MDNEREFEALAGLRFDDVPDPQHRDRLERELLNELTKGRPSMMKGRQSMRIIGKVLTTRRRAVAAAVLVAGIGLLLGLLSRSTSPAYAIEQTVDANRSVRTIHLLHMGGEVTEAWAQFGENGKLELLREEFPQTQDGPKVVVWQRDKAEIWFKRGQGGLLTVREPNKLASMSTSFFDPKERMESLYEAQKNGQATVETEEPSAEGDPIKVTAMWPAKGLRETFLVDPDSKLLKQCQTDRLEGDEYVCVARTQYLDYNRPIDPSVFKLDLPAEVHRIDQYSQDVGLAKKGLGDDEIAVKLAREFFEALIAKDLAEAGRLYGGEPEEWMKEHYGNTTYLRIVSIEKPTTHPNPATQALRVPCHIEIEMNGQKKVVDYYLDVREVQAGRWAIFNI